MGFSDLPKLNGEFNPFHLSDKSLGVSDPTFAMNTSQGVSDTYLAGMYSGQPIKFVYEYPSMYGGPLRFSYTVEMKELTRAIQRADLTWFKMHLERNYDDFDPAQVYDVLNSRGSHGFNPEAALKKANNSAVPLQSLPKPVVSNPAATTTTTTAAKVPTPLEKLANKSADSALDVLELRATAAVTATQATIASTRLDIITLRASIADQTAPQVLLATSRLNAATHGLATTEALGGQLTEKLTEAKAEQDPKEKTRLTQEAVQLESQVSQHAKKTQDTITTALSSLQGYAKTVATAPEATLGVGHVRSTF